MIKEIIEELSEKVKIPLYCAVIVNSETELKINELLPKPKDFNDEFHTTIVYSKKPVEIQKKILDLKDLPYSCEAVVKDWTIFESPNYGRSFVLVLNCPKCEKLFKEWIEKGASFDYDKYIPHLTLYYDLPKDIDPEDLFKKLKGLKIIFDKIRFEEIDENKYKGDS